MASKKRRKIRLKRGEAKTMQAGRQRLPEDMLSTHSRLQLVESPKKVPGPKVRGGADLSRKEVWEKLETAMKTLRAMPDRERRFFAVKTGWPDFVRDYIDAYAAAEEIAPRFQPSPQDISEYLDVLAWARHLEKREFQILWWRSFGLSFGIIGDYIGRSDETARKRFEGALTEAWMAAVGC